MHCNYSTKRAATVQDPTHCTGEPYQNTRYKDLTHMINTPLKSPIMNGGDQQKRASRGGARNALQIIAWQVMLQCTMCTSLCSFAAFFSIEKSVKQCFTFCYIGRCSDCIGLTQFYKTLHSGLRVRAQTIQSRRLTPPSSTNTLTPPPLPLLHCNASHKKLVSA